MIVRDRAYRNSITVEDSHIRISSVAIQDYGTVFASSNETFRLCEDIL